MPSLPPPARRAVFAAASLLVLSCRAGGFPRPSASVAADSAAILRDVAYLASDALEGRATGTPGNDSAAAYLARRYAALRLEPGVLSSGPACAPGRPSCRGWMQAFTARAAARAHAGQPSALPTQNVIAILRGTDPRLRDEFIVLGAHYDHLGRSPLGALDAASGDVIRNGADDNASGTAAVLELARLLARRPPRRSVIFAHFSGEELGLLGSEYFVQNPPVPLERVRAMLNFDMVGRLRDDQLMIYGVATAAELPALVDSANRGARALTLTAIGDGFGASDHSSFYARDLPVLHFFTNVHEDYHRASDDVEKVDAGGIARIVMLAERVVRGIADRDAPLAFTRAAVRAPRVAAREGVRPWLGSVPDMAAGAVAGLRISGVAPGSPADAGGLRAGDVVVELGGKAVTDLYSYSAALYAHDPGDTVAIVVLRDGARLTLHVTLGRRGA